MKIRIVFTFLFILCNGVLLMGQQKYFFQKGLDATDPKDKIEFFTKSLEKEGADKEVFKERGDVYNKLRQFDKAIADYNKAIEIDPKYINAYMFRGGVYHSLHQYDKAIADCTKAIEIDPKHKDAYHIRGFLYRFIMQYDKAIADYTKAIEIDPKDKFAYEIRGDVYTGIRQYVRAIADYTKVIEIDQGYADAFYNRGCAYNELNQYDKAVADISKAIEIDQHYTDAIYRLDFEIHKSRRITLKVPDFSKAIAEYSNRVEIDPKNAIAFYNRGIIYSQLNQYDKAIADFSKAIEINPQYADAIYNRGLAFTKERMIRVATADFSKVIEIDPKRTNAFYRRGYAYSQLNFQEKAIDDYTKSIEIDPMYAEAYCKRGFAYFFRHFFTNAITDCSKAIIMDPEYAEAFNNRGLAYTKIMQYEKAISDFSKAIEIYPKYADAFYRRSIAYNELNQYEKAIADYSKAKEIDPEYAKAPYTLIFTLQKPPSLPPVLSISKISFNDENNNNRIDGDEDCSISFTITNSGKGAARNLKALVQNNSLVSGLSFNNPEIVGILAPNDSQMVKIPITGTMNLTTGTANIKVSFEEQFGFPPDPFDLKIATKEFISPEVKIVDYTFLTDNGILKLGLPIQLKVLIQNVGQGIAENVNVGFSYPNSNVFPSGQKDFTIGTMLVGATKEIIFEFFINKLYAEKAIPISIILAEKYGKFAETKQILATLDTKSAGTTISIASNAIDNTVNFQVASLSADVDKNIPFNAVKYPNRYALIIGNEDYTSRQAGLENESNVEFAVSDAKLFKQYAVNTLGIDEKNTFLLLNATAGEMSRKIELVTQILTRLGENGELFFFYAGHGFPDEKSKIPHLIPVDVSASNLTSAIKLYWLYDKLAQTNAKCITIFLDACFTGGGRESGLLASRGMKVLPTEETISGNIIVFSASSGDQSALSYKEKSHGIFTYFLLKKIQETKGIVTYGQLNKYLQENVSLESLRVNGKAQDPRVNVSSNVQEIWPTLQIY